MATPIRAWSATVLCLSALAGAVAPDAHAQCARWLTGPGQAIQGTNGPVNAFAKMPNGDLIAAGDFNAADSALTNLVARWTGSSWQSIAGGGVPRPNPYSPMIPYAVAASPTGEIYLGGSLSLNSSIYYITRWDGSAWTLMGSGVDNTVRAIAVMPNGDVIAAGDFANAGGAPATRIARWNAASGWAPLGLGLGGGNANALAVLPNGNLLVGGNFQTAGGIPSPNLAVWDGASWSPFPASLFASPNAKIRALLALPDSTIYAGGTFVTASGALNIIKWTGSSWAPLGAGVNDEVRSITQLTGGDIAVGGGFNSAGGVDVAGLAAWNGVAWRRIGSNAHPIGTQVNAVAPLPNNEVAIGVTGIRPDPANYLGITYGFPGVLRSNAGVIVPLGNEPGLSGPDRSLFTSTVTVSSLAALSGGDVVAAGTFYFAGDTANVANVRGMARWDGSRWSRFGAGVNLDAGQRIRTLLALPNNNLVAAGNFTAIDGVPAANIARWNGATWSPLGSGILTGGGKVAALLSLPNGDLIAAGAANFINVDVMFRWNGSAWSAVPSAVVGSPSASRISSLLALPNGDIIVGGSFTLIHGVPASCIARWDGSTWTPLGSGLTGTSDPNVAVLRLLPSGNILAGGSFLNSGANDAIYVAEWNGSTWTSYGASNSPSSLNGPVTSLLVLPDSSLYATGSFGRYGTVPTGSQTGSYL